VVVASILAVSGVAAMCRRVRQFQEVGRTWGGRIFVTAIFSRVPQLVPCRRLQ
jgi:hypothetical protein